MPSFSTVYQNSGPLKSERVSATGLTLTFQHGFQHVRLFDHGALEIQWSKEAHPDFFSYAIESPSTVPLSVSRANDALCIDGEISAKCDVKTGLWTWQMHENQTLVRQEEGLGFGWLGEKAMATFHLEEWQNFFGLGEKGGSLNRRDRAFTNWNTDAFGYGDATDPLYVSVPFYLAVHQGACYGVLIDNTTKSRFNFGASNKRMVQVVVEAGPINLVLIPGPSPAEVLQRYAALTGYMPMPPKWAFGLHQCRYSYYPQHEVENVAFNYRSRNIPADAIYLDIHYMQDYKVFTVNQDRFQNLKALTAALDDKGFKIVPIQDPGIKAETGYGPFDSGTKAEVFVHYPDGKPWEAGVWPGLCHFPDFSKPAARTWWKGLTAAWVKETGVAGLWNDMNEPATWGQDVPDMLTFNLEGRMGNHLEAHNIYGQQMARSTMEGLLKARPGQRPFVLTRAGFAGIQKYAAVWTGDNSSTDEHMFLGIRLVLSLGMSGVPFAGVDVGGFVGEANNPLFSRWISIAAFFPFFRIHSMIDSKDAEPWSFGELAEAIAKNYIRLRYKLLPLLQTAFKTASETGHPILEPFFWRQPGYDFVAAFQHQFYLGSQLLVIPASSNQPAVFAQIPEGEWYHLFNGEAFTGPQTTWLGAPADMLPVLVKAGSALVTQSVGQYTTDPASQDFQIHLFYGKNVFSTHWYDDDGQHLEQKPQAVMSATVEVDFEKKILTINRQKGSEKDWLLSEIFFWHFPFADGETFLVQHEGQNFDLHPSKYQWLEPLPNFDPFEDRGKTYWSGCFSAKIEVNPRSPVLKFAW